MADLDADDEHPSRASLADAHLANVVGMLALDVVTQVSVAVEAATGLSMVQATALSALANYAEGGSVDQLRRSVDLSHSATVRLVDRLQERGLVRRRADAADQRVAAVHLTARGRRTVTAIRVARLDVLRRRVGRLSPAQRMALSGVLEVAATREAGDPSAAGTADYLCRLCEPDACGHPDRCPVTREVRPDRTCPMYMRLAYFRHWRRRGRRCRMMRRRWATGVVLTLFLAVCVSAAPGAVAAPRPQALTGATITGPTPQVYPAFDDPAGDPCPFAIHGVFPVNHVVGYTYADASGSIVAAYYTGALIMRVTRVGTGRSVTVDIGGDGVQTFADDGSSVLYGFGPFSSTQHPGDHPSRELAVLHGISALAIAADGTKTILYSSRVTDLCTKLA